MQIRCRHCNRPYALKRDELEAALNDVNAQNLKHYNSFCHHCGKANRASQKQLKQAAPWWRKPTAESVEDPAAPPESKED
jgi:hypothetical protein